MPQVQAPTASESEHPPYDRPTPVALWSAAVVFLGVALIIRDGNYHPLSVWCVTFALGLAAWAVLGPTWPTEAVEQAIPSIVLAACVVFQSTLLLGRSLIPVGPRFPPVGVLLLLIAVGMTAAALMAAPRWPRARVVVLAVMLLLHVFTGVSVIRSNPQPVMDVFIFQSHGASALLNGENPYAIDFPDLSHGTSPFYAPGVQAGGRLKFGFPYLPLSLLLAAPSHAVSGDVRYAHLLCIAAAAGFMARSRRGAWGLAAAALFLLAPSGLLVLSQSWTEPFVVMLLAATVFCACRRPDLLPLALGLFFAIKQYAFLSAPLALLLLPRPLTLRNVLTLAWKSALVAIVVTLPFVLWDPKAFWWSTVGVQVRQPFRTDALSYLAALANWMGIFFPSAVAFAAMAVVEVLALLRAPRTPAGFAASVALAFLVFFALNKQAFANYYYFVIGATCCAVAAAQTRADDSAPGPAAVQSRSQ